LKITKIKATPVNLPLNFHYLWSMGVFCGMTKVIIEVETDEGIIGLGEATSASLLPAIESIAELLIGKNPLDIVDCETTVMPEWRTLLISGGGDSIVKAFGAIDMALWDIKGKYFNQPLYMLLGGAYRKEISFTEYFGFEGLLQSDGTYKQDLRPEAVVEYCLKMKEEHGTTNFEGKFATSDDIWTDIKTVELLREALGKDAMLRLDANYGYSLSTMKQVFRELEQYNIRNFEDPGLTFEDMAELKRYTSIPFSTHPCDIRRAVSLGAPDNFCGNPTAMGGVMNTVRFIGACEQFGKGFWFYSGDAGIATSLYLHISAASNHMNEPSQSLMRWQDYDVIQNGPFKPVNNVIKVPEGPGLGVELDRKSLERLHKDYVDNGAPRMYYSFKDTSKYERLPRI
jgi:glucarate dehydratase